MGGGHIGGSDNGVAGAGGTLTISGNILVISSRVSSDGKYGELKIQYLKPKP